MILPRCGHGSTVMFVHQQGVAKVALNVGETRDRLMVVKKRIPS